VILRGATAGKCAERSGARSRQPWAAARAGGGRGAPVRDTGEIDGLVDKGDDDDMLEVGKATDDTLQLPEVVMHLRQRRRHARGGGRGEGSLAAALGRAAGGRASAHLAVVVHCIDREDDLGLDLAEAVEDALHAKVGRGGAPDGADARCGQHAHERLEAVGDVA